MKRFTTIVNSIAAVGMIFLGWSASDAAAGAVYVATTGNDNNSGSLAAPFATPARALTEADRVPGIDAIYLRAPASDLASRRYTITQTLSVRKPGLTIATNPGDPAKAAIVAGAKINGPQSVIAVYASGVTIANLEIQGGAYYGIKLDDANGAQTGQKILGNYIHHTGRDGIKAQRADGVLIENNEIGPTGVRDASNAEGIDMIGSKGAIIRGNYIHDITTNGLYVKGGTANAIVEKNLVVNTGYAGILLGSETDVEFIRNYQGNYGDSDGSNPLGHEALNSVARNNIVVNAAMAGLGTIAGNNVRFLNNTLVNVARTNQGAFRAAPNQFGTLPTSVVFKNNVVILDPTSTRPLVYLYKSCDVTSNSNLWFSDGGPSNFVLDSTPAPCVNKTYSFSQWQTEAKMDGSSRQGEPGLDPTDLYRLLGSSPAIDSGEALSEVTDDYFGVSRPQGRSYDIGAHEGVATTRVVPVAPSALDAIARSATQIDLTWSDGNLTDTQTGFRIERSTDGGATFTVILTTAGTSFSDFDVTGNATYHYRVAAYNGRSISPYSNVDSVKTPRR
jgi:hypothetical protein